MDEKLQDVRDERRDEPPAFDYGTARRDEPPVVEGRASTRVRYTLNFTGAPSLSQLVAVAVATAFYTVFSWLAVVSLPSGFAGVSSIFLAIGFGIPFAIWFGGWAFVIAYIGNFVGAGLLAGFPLNVAIPFGLADIIQLGLPMLLYRLFAPRFGLSSIGKDVYTLRGFIFFLLCAVLPNNILGAFYGNAILIYGQIGKPELYLASVFAWVLSNVVVTIIIAPALLSGVGPIVERFGLTIRNLFN